MIALSNISKHYGAQTLFEDASFQLNPGDKAGLVGLNGSGKTTIFRLLVGEEQPEAGVVSKAKHMTVGYFRQDVGDWSGRTVLAETIAGAGVVADLGEELLVLEAQMSDPEADLEKVIERYGEVQARYQELGGYELEPRARTILAGLGVAADQVDGDVGKLSGGWKMRVALAKILLAKPDTLLLDEPTNYLDIESILWLETFLRDYAGAVLMTCHDREVMNRIASRIIEIDNGQVTNYTGDYDFYEQARALEATRRAAQYERQQAMLAKESRFIDRFAAQASKAAQVQSRVKKLDKIEKLAPPRRMVERTFKFRDAARSGTDVVKVAKVRKAYGARVVHDDLSLVVRRGERWAVMGANGAGKSTLLKMMAGVLQPDSGTATLGASVNLGYFAQHHMDHLDGDISVLQTLLNHTRTIGIGLLRNAAGAFGFHGDDVEKSVSVLSGGERARLALLKIMFDTPNLLVLDEPTNHLDLITKNALIRMLKDYQGTIVFVSHDRAFLRAMSTHVLELSPEGPHVYAGSYDEYVASTGHAAPGMRED
jgi:ATPase subunit of ABC transporter with duplicated ATPase domains